MQLLRKLNCYKIVLLLGAVSLIHTSAIAGNGGGIVARAVLDGGQHQIKVDSARTVEDSAFFNPVYTGSIDTSYRVQNLVTLKINEASFLYLRSAFSVTVQLRIIYSNGANTVDSISRNFTVNYDSAHPYNSRNNFVFSGAHRVTIKVLSVTSNVTNWDPVSVLVIENQLVAQPDFAFSCTNTVTNITVTNPGNTADELPISWTAINGADQYDLEWTYIDKSALDSNRYGSPINNKLIFLNNATRISTTGTAYNIPLIYDDSGTLFIRVRPTQIKLGNAVLAAQWSSDASTPVLGQFAFIGHERPLNWQSNISFAEEGKRKVVVQYFDGSLRSRQTVTKDNTTNTTIVAETYYDYQGRPAIQVMPSPTLNTIIQYTASFNVTINGAEYSQSNYDTLPEPGTFCSIHADPMGSSSGAGQYYSPDNPVKTSGMNQFIPDAHNYPFTETEYMPDNTGRISRQGGVGPDHQLGSGHETKYYYGTPDQNELDALFGTDVGDHTHYFKNMVRDANGQYSVTYSDMHGRNIATALAGATSPGMASLASNTGGATITENLADSGSVFFRDLSILSQKSLLVSTAGNYQFHYGLTPQALTEPNCSQQPICYTCLYDLEVTITDNCNNQLLGGKAYDTVLHNFSFGAINTSCTGSTTPMSLDFTLPMQEGSYVVTKKLTVNKDAYIWYRDSIYLPNNTCRSYQDFVNEQRAIVAQANTQCAPTCDACRDSLGTWDQYWAKFIAKTGLQPSDTAAYHDEVYQSYQDALASCNALCGDSLSDADDIRQAMLQDMTPPFGQYADTSKTGDLYSIFYIPANDSLNYVPVYKIPGIVYLNDNNQPDSVYNQQSNLMVTPNTLTASQFTQNFQSSWATALLPYHPEYCKLLTLESLNPSNYWDRRMEAIDNFRDAYNQGFLNPTGNSTSPFNRYPIVSANIDPLLQESSTAKGKLESKLSTYLAASGGNPALSMWGLSCTMAKCADNDKACAIFYSNPSNDFDTTVMCEGDRDMAWRFFRQLYQGIKEDLVNDIVNNTSGCTPRNTAYNNNSTTANALHADKHTPEFNSKVANSNDAGIQSQSYLSNITASNTTKSQTEVQDSLNSFYDQNCADYAQQWAQQLSACQYGPDLQDTILPRLKALCRQACDSMHPYGASSLAPGQTYTPAGTAYQFTSFEDIIDTYNQLHNITATTSCNAELITAPAPYGSQPSYTSLPIYGKPSTCECTIIRSFYLQYKVTGKNDASFSAWMLRTQNTSMTESDLSQLLAMCGNSNTTTASCTWLPKPIYLPPALQCNSGSVCVSCTLVDSFYHTYLQRYPADTPSVAGDPNDTIQLAKNQLFQNYMNNRLGFSKETWEYLQFMDTCAAHTAAISNTTECLPGTLGNIFNSGGADQLSDIQATADKGYIIAGNTSGIGAGGKDAYIVKAAHDGTVQWAKTYGGTAEDRFIRVKTTSDNGYIAIGTTKSAAFARGEMLLVKVNATGATQWTKAIGFGTPNGEYGYDVIQTSDGGYAALGVYNQHGGTGDLLLARLDTGGAVTWTHRYGSGIGDNSSSCTIDDVDTINYGGSPAYGLLEHNDTLVIGGTSYDPNLGSRYYGAIYKVDEAQGDLLSAWHYADNENRALSTWFGDIHVTGSGYLLSVTNAPHFGSAAAQTAVVSLSASGAVNAFRRFNLPAGNSTITSAAMYPAFDGGYLVGQTGDASSHIFWQRVDASGSLLWASETILPGTQILGRLTQNADSTFTAVGTTGNNALVLNLLATAATGCYDSSVDLDITSPPLTKINWAVEASQALTLANTSANLSENSPSLGDSSLACSQNGQCYNVYNGPTLCGKSAPLFPPVAVDSTTGCTDSTFFAVSKATELYKSYTDSLTGDFEQRYMNTCMQAYRNETFTVTYLKNEYHYTLYYYDQAGNLVRTVPPAGVHQNTDPSWLAQVQTARANGGSLTPGHTLTTEYRYNTLNQVVAQHTPDAGMSYFWYDRLGRVCVSQNARQNPNNQYSYTEYDTIGRIIQVGQLVSASAPTDSITRIEAILTQWLATAGNTADQITKTVYDYPYTPLGPVLSAQNVRNRVAWMALYNTAADMNNAIPAPAAASYYSYDILGNVDTLVQDYGRSDYTPTSNVMNSHGNRFKKIVYDFDLVSGKVNQVSYQHGQADAFYHTYIYDAENRITNVQSSTDSINWDNDAFYSYYAHGPLARTILGEQQVQGLNYAYTLQGWIKTVNPSIYTGSGYALQPDGSSGSVVAASAYSYMLNYYNGDYIPISGATPPDTLINTALGSDYHPLFNGNISNMGVNISALSHPLLYNYQYDQLNRLVQMNAWNRTGSAWNNITKLADFAENVSYDPNGNILGYKRNGNNTFAGSPVGMDSMNYVYTPGTNQLDHVTDSVPAGNYANDIDGQQPGNYRYDPIGNMVFDSASGISEIDWTVYDKISRITKTNGTVITYTYDPSGNRISKTVVTADSTLTTWYVREAKGNTMSVYTAGSVATNSGHLTQTELDIYGNARLGILQTNVNVQDSLPGSDTTLPSLDKGFSLTFARGYKLFELSNHLGNVLVTISDKKYGVSLDDSIADHFIPEVVSANDYYPFGMLQPGREYNEPGTAGYRYGFNGQEKDNEVNGDGNSYTAQFWEFDTRTGRRWNLDPKPIIGVSEYSAFSDNPIWHNDVSGDSAAPVTPIKAPIFSIHVGTTYGPAANGKTSIFPLLGDQTYYNSNTGNGITEPNHFTQIQVRLKGPVQVEFVLFKQKMNDYPNTQGYRLEAPTAAELGVAIQTKSLYINRKISISGNNSFSAGPTLAHPLFDAPPGVTPAGTVDPWGPSISTGKKGDKYYIVGAGASIISRVDITFFRYFNLFLAQNIHYLHTIPENSTVNGQYVQQPSRNMASYSITGGIGISLGGSRKP